MNDFHAVPFFSSLLQAPNSPFQSQARTFLCVCWARHFAITPLCNHDTLELSDILSLAVSRAACHSVYISGYIKDKLDGLRIAS